jgi:DNA-directed RNA polymerase subunit H (RpoH/RPB5)
MIEQTRVNDEVWLPKHVAFKVDVRLALLKEYNVEQEQTFRDYKKFSATTRIVGVGEIQDK